MNKVLLRRSWNICDIPFGLSSELVSRVAELHHYLFADRPISSRIRSTWGLDYPPARRLGITRGISTMKHVSGLPRAKFDEVVDDSEPEREEARKRRRAEKQRRSGKSRSPSESVYVVTDYEMKTTSPVQTKSGPIIISSDCSESATSSPRLPPPPVYISSAESATGGESSSLPDLNMKDFIEGASNGKSVADTGILAVVDCEAELEETTSRMRTELNRFVYSSLPGANANSSSSRSSSVTSHYFVMPPSEETKKANKTAHAKEQYTTLVGFSEKQLVPLRKCVSCNVAWTTRKTVAQKVSHIKTCSRKAKFSEETLKVLILKELESIPPEEANKAKGKRKKTQQIEDAHPKTFLEEVVDDAQIQRQKKRKAAVSSSVKSVAETREIILDKARQLLHPPVRSYPPEISMPPPPPSTQAFGLSRLGSGSSPCDAGNSDQGPQSTQAFGKSTLAERFVAGSSTAGLFSADDLPSTQVFGASRLGSALRISGPSSCWSESNTSSMVRRCDTSPVGLPTSLSVGDGRSLRVLNDSNNGVDMPDKDESMRFDYDEDVLGKDEAILIFEPDQDIAGSIDVQPSKSRLLGILDGQPIYDETNANCKKHTKPISATKTKSTPKKKKKASEETSTAQKKNIDEEELSSRLKALILADEQLYMRILRYEPLHFDVFLNLVKEDNIHAISLKSKVRAFLDKQAIQYHENEPGQRGRRRR